MLDLYVYLLIASAILSWLIAFNVVNTRNQFVAAVAEFLYRITEPVLGADQAQVSCPVSAASICLRSSPVFVLG